MKLEHVDWIHEALKGVCILGAAFLVVVVLTNAQMTLVIEDCEATGTYLWGDEVIECKVREVKP